MRAFMCIDPAGRIIETGAVQPQCWDKMKPRRANCALEEITHEQKLALDGEGADRFFVENGEIKRKEIVTLVLDKPTVVINETAILTHDAPTPMKIIAGHNPVNGQVHGKVHSQKGHSFSSREPGVYTLKLRDPRYWAEPVELRVTLPKDEDKPAKEHVLDGIKPRIINDEG